jgi:hypothetical protein
VNANCRADEIDVAEDPYGDIAYSCSSKYISHLECHIFILIMIVLTTYSRYRHRLLFGTSLTDSLGGRKRALCCKVHVPKQPKSRICRDACLSDPDLCINGGLPLWLESGLDEDGEGRSRKRDLSSSVNSLAVYHPLDKRRQSSFGKKVKELAKKTAQKLRGYFSRGKYFSHGQGPAQGMFRQAAPLQPPPLNHGLPGIGLLDNCMNGNVEFLPMTAQSQLTKQLIADYKPETEHPFDVGFN